MKTFFGEGNLAHLRLGTRRSLLAMSQSGWVASEVARLNPGVTVELVGIDTRGDKVLDVPLTQVQGKEFFVAELDESLRSGQVDFSVHSMKDLSLDRPEDFVLAAVPKRENQRDIAVFSGRVMERLAKGLPIRIGTSSPRRQENLPSFLRDALPQLAGQPQVQLVDLRGNVNTRLGRLHEEEESAKQLDGVVLAFAGMIRLWANQTARLEMERLLQGTRFMILPLTQNPAAASQGVLAVECRKSDQRVRSILQVLHSETAAHEAQKEREVLRKWGGGCHQRFGASAITHPELGAMMFVRGSATGGKILDEIEWETPAHFASHTVPLALFDGSERKGERVDLPTVEMTLAPGAACFVAHSAGVSSQWVPLLQKARVWTSGATSWFKLAKKGLWVEGCAEGLGFEWLRPQLNEPLLRLPTWGDSWTILTHRDAAEGWSSARVVSTYQVIWRDPIKGSLSDEIAQAKHCYWSSFSQWNALGAFTSAGAIHSCGPGKTAEKLRQAGIKPLVFPSAKAWRSALERSL